MTSPNESNNSDPSQWTEQQAIDLWKYFGTVGAADKNTMVAVAGFLLSLSVGLVGYVVASSLVRFHPPYVSDPQKAICVAVIGGSLSWLIYYVSVLYAGYSNWNWAQADAIANGLARRYPKWEMLLPEYSPFKGAPKAKGICARALRWGKPCVPAEEVAPIFRLYAWAAVALGILHVLVLGLAIYSLPYVLCAADSIEVVCRWKVRPARVLVCHSAPPVADSGAPR
jgi:hypothetical protein